MVSPVTYEAAGGGRQLVKLGDVTIGEVVERSGLQAWRLFLPDTAIRTTVRADTTDVVAKRKIDAIVAEWLYRAGVALTRSDQVRA